MVVFLHLRVAGELHVGVALENEADHIVRCRGHNAVPLAEGAGSNLHDGSVYLLRGIGGDLGDVEQGLCEERRDRDGVLHHRPRAVG